MSPFLPQIKSLSVNNVYGQFYFPERDDRGCKMVESKEAAFELLISHEQLAKATEPAMRDFHNPSPGALRRMSALFIGFLPAPFDMGDVAMFFYGARGSGACSVSIWAAIVGRVRRQP